MEMVLSREDVLREEALVRAREVSGPRPDADTVVETAKKFYTFLKG